MSLEAVSEEVKEEKWFQTNHLQGDLKARSVRGGVSTMAAQIFSFVMNIAQSTIMARLLVPEDYGLIAMVASITGFITLFKDLGLSSAVIQKEKLTQSEVSSVFWVNVLISLGIALFVALLAPGIVYFYEEDRLLLITLVFALNIFIMGLSLQHNALMKRQMRFKSLALIQLTAVGTNVIAGIILAWLGFGYWALVIQGLIFSVLQTGALWLLCDWRPDLAFKKANVGSFLKFGAGVTGFDVVNHFSRNMDNVFIGKFVSTVALGLYSKAYQLLMLPITQLRNPLNSVAIPALSSLQNDGAKFRNFYSRYLFILAFFSMPIVVYLGVFAEELIIMVLGEQWKEAGYLFQLLAIAAFIQPVASTPGIILITTGSVKRYFNIGLVNAICMVSGFAIGVFTGGVSGVAIAQAVVVYTLFLPVLYYSLHKTPVSVALYLKEISLPATFSLISGVAMAVYAYYMSQLSLHLSPMYYAVYCACGFIVGAVVYIGLMIIFPTSRKKFKQILDIGSFMKKGKTAK
ncbi:lipopolysaccharide biosynthesis protein [Pontibacter silvestris]|uniref:Lipopolysaccharide biosynthesis protein n=1 Tax=Pontibacter silvestris TaxID=2305183 RepID=A0ABW4WWN7_9BACT|nr:lipopolysaccharide biosynthesis protein [Pontibacter silvestris]MCC9138820.1 lipopolysaccharide biosynthesis protein [Pontibacter silvestris]